MSAETEFRPLLSQSVGYGVVVGTSFIFIHYVFRAYKMCKVHRLLTLLFGGIHERIKERKAGLGVLWDCQRMDLECNLTPIEYGCIYIRSFGSLVNYTLPFPRIFLILNDRRWYGVGGTIQLAIFGMVAAKVKMNANGAHTFLEIVRARFRTGPHILFTFYAFTCIMIVCGSLLLGGAATVTALTGMNTMAACFLLPIGIAVYVIVGGLRATFICDWSHTVILFVIIYIFLFRAYGTSSDTGGLSGLYDLLVAAGEETPVEGNQNGSYLTMKSNQGLVFGAATILSGFSGVFCDQGYWQRAIASHPSSTTKAYMLGGLSWFAVPFAFASCLGLAARALLHHPDFPTYPNPLSESQTSAGLAAPAAAAVLMGKGGAVAVLLVVFMAVTSATSAELIAVSSLFSYDIYRTYFKPNAKGAQIVRVSHYFICFWAIWMGCWAVILNKAGVDLGWLFYVQGVILSPAVIPIALTVTWRKLTAIAVCLGAILGAILGLTAWIIGCWKIYGTINIANLAKPYSAVCSGLTGLLFSGIITVGVSLLSPANYDFQGTRGITRLDDFDDSDRTSENGENIQEKKDDVDIAGADEAESQTGKGEIDMKTLQAAFKRAACYSLTLTLIVAIVVPLPMFFSHYVYDKEFYKFWASVTIIWALMSGTWSYQAMRG
ncbi:related to DUR3-Urea permease [Armillaria ostoyae]|uniref:Related to DUR3-Urea permease n=1 Tax=Armillaria ostoyae TaxID=47428 RepID=A0A284RI95_ARMOS|nr:related to DUR3-Urea permease [Armillaria ostoyae]